MARIGPYWFLDRLGWPVVTIQGRPAVNLIRLLLHTRKLGRWDPPEMQPTSEVTGAPNDVEDTTP